MKVKFPLNVLKPIQMHLKNEEKKLKKRQKELEKEDPFRNTDRLIDNAALDTEAAEEAGHERISALKLEISKNLVRIRKALTRIKIGKYGLCTKCGHMINTERLAIDPSATLCVECAKKVED